MKKQSRLSGPALFMYGTIFLMVLLSALFLGLYYTNVCPSDVILWCGIVSFMILYHFGLRILFGEITKCIQINYKHPFFRRREFEKKLYSALRVRSWKDRVLTFDPASYDFRTRTLEQLATTMAKSETDHWINELISLSSLLFSLLWGEFPIFLITCLAAMVFDAQFIIVQRFNRPIVLRLMKHRAQRLSNS